MLSMKMVILEVAGAYAAALSDDGTVSRIPNQNYRVGQTLTVPNKKERTHFTVYAKRVAAIAAAFIILLMGAGVLTRTPVTYVSLDVNPSVEYKLNVFDQVVKVVMVNKDAEFLLKDTALLYQPASTAVKKTVELLGQNNYFKEAEKNNIVLSATGSGSKKSKAVLDTVAKATKEAAESMSVSANIITFESSMSDLKQAEKLGTTPGKMLLVNSMVNTNVRTLNPQSGEATAVHELLSKPVADLVDAMGESNLDQMTQSTDGVNVLTTSPESSLLQTESPVNTDAGSNSEQHASSEERPSAQNPTTSDSGTSSSEESQVMDPSEIPPVNPGVTTSGSEDETVSSSSENAPDFSEIPSVTPGIGAEDTEDEQESGIEQAPDVTEETVSSSEASESGVSSEEILEGENSSGTSEMDAKISGS